MAGSTINIDGKDFQALESLIELDRLVAEGSLAGFVKMAWQVLEPGQPLAWGWALDAVCEHLEAIADEATVDGNIYNRLLINIPPGPMRDDSVVETRHGPVLLRDIAVGDEVLTHKGRYRRVEEVHDQGTLPILRIETNTGRVTHAAPTHPYLTPSGWVKASDLGIGDVLAVINPKEDRHKGGTIPEVARLLGYMVGDGGLTQRTIMFTNGDADTIADFEHCCEVVGFKTSKYQRGNWWVLRVLGGKAVHEFFAGYGLTYCNSYQKRIPEQVRTADNETLRNFIGAYWACDGTIAAVATKARGSVYKSSCTTVNLDLAQDILFALQKLGIFARLRKRTMKKETAAQPGGLYRSYDVAITRERHVALFADMPGLSARKNALTKKCRQGFKETIWEDEIVSITQESPAHCMCLTVEDDHSFTCSGIAVKNCLKSMLVSVFLPAWVWGPCKTPYKRFISASHSMDISIRDSLRTRRLVTSEWYQQRWPEVKITPDQNQKTYFENTDGGFRQASAAGGITGKRADIVIVDDPLSVDDANSDKIRASTNQWFQEAVPLRLNNPDSSSIIVIMQRLHEDDVSGIILDKDLGYDALILPMEYETWRVGMATKLGFVDPRTAEGELLFPERFPGHVVERDKKVLGPFAVAGQYQQTPTPRGGGVIKRDWWQLYLGSEFPPFAYIVASLDTAYTLKQENDLSAMTVWGVFTGANARYATNWSLPGGRLMRQEGSEEMFNTGTEIRNRHASAGGEGPKVMLAYCWAERLELHELVNKVGKTCKDMKVDVLLIENKASGISVAQELRRLFGHEDWGVQLVNPGAQDKLARMYSIQHIFAEGMVYAPDKKWSELAIQQASVFPKGKNDDICDTISQAIRHLRDIGLLTRAPEWQADQAQGLEQGSQSSLPPLYPC